MITYKVIFEGFCFTVELTEGEKTALENDGAVIEKLQEGR